MVSRPLALACLGLALPLACSLREGASNPPAPVQAAAPERPSDGVAPRREAGASPQPLAREFRAAWVATVDNIDWPSRPGLPTAEARAELDAIVARAAALGLNALVFQVRAAGDAFYPSSIEPWSEWLTGAQGRAPDVAWDPLAHLIERGHAQGLQVHAWFNPFRAAHPAGTSPPGKSHVLSRLPSVCVKYGKYRWMDPGDDRARRWTLAVIRDVVERYDLDGVHIDDYFYPYPEKGEAFPDQRSFAAYQKGSGPLALADWRRANIDGFVRTLYEQVHATKPWVQVGISPFGIARPGVPSGIQAGIDQYAQLYADVPKWLREGWLDYLAPQLYWPIDQQAQSFAVLLPWWHGQNPRQRHIWPGINPGRALEGKPPTRRDEIADQIALIRAQTGPPGHIHFSFKALRRPAANVAGVLQQRLYREPALVPAVAWLGSAAPPAPQAQLTGAAGARTLRWQPSGNVRFVAVQAKDARGWRTHAIVGADVGSCPIPDGTTAVAVTAVGRTGVSGPATLLTAP